MHNLNHSISEILRYMVTEMRLIYAIDYERKHIILIFKVIIIMRQSFITTESKRIISFIFFAKYFLEKMLIQHFSHYIQT